MDIGTALGQKVTSANARAGELMGQGMSAAANLQSQAAQAKASGLASLGQGIAGLGRQYDQNVLFEDWMNRAFPTTPASIEERSLGGGMTRGINLLGGQYGFPSSSSDFSYI
jgi:hypothetical protein